LSRGTPTSFAKGTARGRPRLILGPLQPAQHEAADEDEQPQVLGQVGLDVATGIDSRKLTGALRIRISTQRRTAGETLGRASSRIRIAYSHTAASANPTAARLAA
jgi:hypothetical protein